MEGIQFERGRLSAEVGKAEYSKETVNTTATTQASSTIAVNDSLAMESGKDIVVAGSDINAGGDVVLAAEGDVRIETTEERTETTTEKIEGKADLTVGVKHQSTEVAYAAIELKNACVKESNAIKELKEYKKQINKANEDHEKGLITQDELDDIEGNLKYYEMAVALATAEVAVKTAALVQQLAASAASAETYGFTGDLQLKIDAEVKKIHDVSTKAKGSNITTGGSFTIESDKTAKIEGSTVKSAGDVSIEADTVEILAGKNTSEHSENTTHGTLTMTMSTGGASGNLSVDKTIIGSESTSWTNSTLDGSNITIKSAKDTTVRGGNVTAADELALDTGGNLTVESVQDKSSNKSVTIGVSAGANKGDSSTGKNGGANLNISQEKSAWVNTQTSLKGESVDIYVEDNTKLKGALITSTTGDLALSTGTLEFEDIRDRDSSFNMGAGIGFDSTNTAGTQGTNNPQVGVGAMPENKPGTPGTTDTSEGINSASVGFSDKRQTNFATIGAGLITVRDAEIDLSKLNRDETVSQYGTMDAGVQLSADKDLINGVTNIVDTVKKTDEAMTELEQDLNTGIEKTINLVADGHFVTDENLALYTKVDAYEDKIANGLDLTAKEKLDYYDGKTTIGEVLTPAEQSDLLWADLASDKEDARVLSQNILMTYTDSGMPWSVTQEKLEKLRELDPEAAREIDTKFALERQKDFDKKLADYDCYSQPKGLDLSTKTGDAVADFASEAYKNLYYFSNGLLKYTAYTISAFSVGGDAPKEYVDKAIGGEPEFANNVELAGAYAGYIAGDAVIAYTGIKGYKGVSGEDVFSIGKTVEGPELPGRAVAGAEFPSGIKDPKQYSVAYEMKLDEIDLGKSRSVHNNRANAALDNALRQDPEYAAIMEELIPNVQKSVSKTGGRTTPEDWTWEHASKSTTNDQVGIMRLVPKSQHTPGSPYWRVIHPNAGASGGYSEWAIPNGAPNN